MTIGFIGLGIMGKPMARNLLKAGYRLVVYDILPGPIREVVQAWAAEGASPADVASREIAADLAGKGVEMLDVPVSGGEPKAIDGTLAIMAGGKTEVFERVKDVLLKMGASAVLCGDIGAGWPAAPC